MNTLLATMHPDELKQIKAELGCETHGDLAEMIGVSRCAVSLWANGRGIPRPIAMLLRTLAHKEMAA